MILPEVQGLGLFVAFFFFHEATGLEILLLRTAVSSPHNCEEKLG